MYESVTKLGAASPSLEIVNNIWVYQLCTATLVSFALSKDFALYNIFVLGL